MTAPGRMALAANAMALATDPLPRHAAALSRRLAGRPRPALRIADVASMPEWLRLTPTERQRLGNRAALALIAPAIAASVDGCWLGGLARIAGDDALDWANRIAPHVSASAAPFDATALPGIAAAMLRNAAPAALRDHVAPAPETTVKIDAALGAAAFELALSDRFAA